MKKIFIISLLAMIMSGSLFAASTTVEIKLGKYDKYDYMTWGTYYMVTEYDKNTDKKVGAGNIYKGWVIPYSFQWLKKGKEQAYARNSIFTFTDRINIYSSRSYSKNTEYLGQVRRRFFSDVKIFNFYNSEKEKVFETMISEDQKTVEICSNDDKAKVVATISPSLTEIKIDDLGEINNWTIEVDEEVLKEYSYDKRNLVMFAAFYIDSFKKSSDKQEE